MVIVDSTIWIDYLNGKRDLQTEWLDAYLPRERIGLADLTLCEVLQGFREQVRFERAYARLMLLPVVNTGGAAIAIAAAENYRILRAKGITVRKTIDCLIATFCIRHGHVLLHRDRDFDPFEKHLGLRVVHP